MLLGILFLLQLYILFAYFFLVVLLRLKIGICFVLYEIYSFFMNLFQVSFTEFIIRSSHSQQPSMSICFRMWCPSTDADMRTFTNRIKTWDSFAFLLALTIRLRDKYSLLKVFAVYSFVIEVITSKLGLGYRRAVPLMLPFFFNQIFIALSPKLIEGIMLSASVLSVFGFNDEWRWWW